MSVLYPEDEALAHAVFDALMTALAEPGLITALPQPGLAPFVDTLIDLDTTCHNLVPELEPLIRASRSRQVPLSSALHVFAPDAGSASRLVRDLARGSALYPDQGATLYVSAPHKGTRLRLSGPGIRSSVEVATALPADFWQARAEISSYPEGFEVVVVDGDQLIAIPRSTKVECL